MSKSSGITGAQYLTRKAGVKVYQRLERDKPTCVVEQNGRVISEKEDDVWGSLCLFTFIQLLQAAARVFSPLREYPPPPAFRFLSKFDVKQLVGEFDFEDFEENILPTLTGKTNYDRIVKDWEVICNNDMIEGDAADLLEVYDWIVRLRLLQRGEKGGGKIVLPENIRTDVEQLGCIGDTEFARVTNAAFLPAFQALFPLGEVQGDVFIANPAKHTQNIFGFGMYVPPPVTWAKTELDVEVSPSFEVADQSLANRVVTLLGRPRQKMTPDQNGFLEHGGHPELLDAAKGGLGKSALRGLRSIAGEGPVEECVSRLAEHFARKLPGTPQEKLLDLAAGRIAAMQGDYRAERYNEDGTGKWRLVIKNVNNL